MPLLSLFPTMVTAARRTALRFAVQGLTLGLFSLFLIQPLFAQTQVASAERVLFDSLNHERTAQGLPTLKWDEALAAAAREHATRMAERNTLAHQLPGEPAVQDRATLTGARFSEIAENIAVAPNAASIHSAWMKSPHHRENILDPELNTVGIGVVKGPDGLFAVQDFSQAVASLNFDQQEQEIIANLKAHGVHAVQASADARRTCDMDKGYAGNRPLSVFRFESASLDKLPFDLEQKLSSGHFHSAAVGACEGGGSSGFTRFRIAVMLF